MTSPVLPARLVEFAGALRSKGIAVGTSETVDAAAVMNVLGLSDRNQLREGLGAAFVRRDGQRDVFDALFDIYFPSAAGAAQTILHEPAGTREHPADTTIDVTVDIAHELRRKLLIALTSNDASARDTLLEAVAKSTVDLLGGVQAPEGSGVPASSSVTGWSAHQALQRLQPRQLIAQAAAQRTGQLSGRSSGQLPARLNGRLPRDEVRSSVERFGQHVQTHARRRTAELRGRDQTVTYAVRSGTEHTDFLSANAEQLAALRRTVWPLARKLSTRLNMRRRRGNRGGIDIRRTVRQSLQTGGVPLSPVYQKPRPSRPELVLMCDLSGSVAGFSQFTMLLVKALAEQFSRVRIFAFINSMADVSELMAGNDEDMLDRIRREAKISSWHSSSDYGEAFADFRQHHLGAIGPRTTVLILGDARNNNQDPNVGALRTFSDLARRVYWLNPEPSRRWDDGDSVASTYADVVQMHECCNLVQLTKFVNDVMPVH